jgi:hypothetical protein
MLPAPSDCTSRHGTGSARGMRGSFQGLNVVTERRFRSAAAREPGISNGTGWGRGVNVCARACVVCARSRVRISAHVVCACLCVCLCVFMCVCVCAAAAGAAPPPLGPHRARNHRCSARVAKAAKAPQQCAPALGSRPPCTVHQPLRVQRRDGSGQPRRGEQRDLRVPDAHAHGWVRWDRGLVPAPPQAHAAETCACALRARAPARPHASSPSSLWLPRCRAARP